MYCQRTHFPRVVRLLPVLCPPLLSSPPICIFAPVEGPGGHKMPFETTGHGVSNVRFSQAPPDLVSKDVHGTTSALKGWHACFAECYSCARGACRKNGCWLYSIPQDIPFCGGLLACLEEHVWKNFNSQTAETAHQHDYTSDARSSETACQSVPGGVRATTILR